MTNTNNIAKGTRIMLVSTNDPYTHLAYGAMGTVWKAGPDQIEVDWDCGSKLALIPSEGDRFEVEG